MGKVEQLAGLAGQLSEEQLDSVIEFATSLKNPTFYETAPPEARASIDRGLADLDAGRTVSLDHVMREINVRIASKR